MPFHHGITIQEPIEGIAPILEKSTAIIGVVVTGKAEDGEATTALDAAFPLNRAVRVVDLQAAAALATSGTMANVLKAIAAQGTPHTIVVRVAEGEDAGETETNVIGGSVEGQYTGMQALLSAQAQLGLRPRILGAPGLDTEEVVSALVTLAQTLRGFVYASCRGAEADTIEGATAYRGQFGARELMLIWPDLTGWDGKAIGTILGLRAMTDEKIGWHKSISNIVFNGATGITKDVSFDIRDPSTDAGVLNENQVTTIINWNGFRYWGNRTTSDITQFAFEVATRTAQALQDLLAEIEAPFIDRPMTAGLVRDMIESGSAGLRRYRTAGFIIGGRVWFDGNPNPAESLSAGILTIDADYTSVAPMEHVINRLRVTSRYYENFGDQIQAANPA